MDTLVWTLFFLGFSLCAADEDDAFTHQQEENIAIVSIFFSCISFCGSSFIVFMYIRHPQLRSFVFQLVVWISASDIMYSIANAIGNPSDGSAACYTQAIMIQFFGLSSMLWTVTIAYTVDRVYLKGRSIEEAAEIKKTFHYIVWGISLLLTILPATTGNYGQSTGWCWIDVKENAEAGTAWRFVTFYIPLWLVAGYNLSVYAHVRSALNAAVEQGGENAGNIAGLQRMVYYPLVLVVCYIFGTISRIQQIFGPPVYGLVILHTIGMSSQGTLNALVYGLTPSVKRVMCGEGSKLDEPSVQNVDRMDDGLVSVGLDDAKSGDAHL
uniref:G-protein coupled receptors family 2 profile 2 domain-containing protein n=1 Tax=Lotharella oceanica TaxID=641309 RepID=A0A7S2TMP9_9EUKA|mmetsp:Transcript_19595/g.36892  ORF Transcript_19595/g.36892 Transcript_19595/m.36892 type:complete len:325 (+) Transcript_19595:16-990(+)